MFNREHFLQHYHKRSNVDTTFSMIKMKFGEVVKAKLPVGQVNEVLCKILCHNLCVLIQSIYELKLEPTFWEGMERL
jgi:transposase